MKFTDETKSIIDMGGGVFVPVDPMNRDYREIVLPAVERGETIQDPDAPPEQPADPVEALKAALVEKGLLTTAEADAQPIKKSVAIK